MGDLPHPPKLKLTPHLRAFLAGELYPPEEPYEQPPRIDEETRQRNLQGIEAARAALHSKKPYKEGTEGMWALAAGRLAGGAVAKHVGTKTGSSMVGRMAGSAAASGVNDMLSGDHRAYEAGTEGMWAAAGAMLGRAFVAKKVIDGVTGGGGGESSGPPQSAMGINSYNMAGTQGQWPGMADTRSETSRARIIRQQKQRQAAERDLVEEAEQGGIPLVTTFDQAEQAMLSASNQGTVPHPGNPRPDSIHQRPKMNVVEGLEEFNEQNLLWEEGVAGQWFYDVKPSPTDYFKAGTHGQEMGPIYNNYGSTGFAQPAVTTPKKAGPPPPGATSSRPVEDKPPTLSSRSYFSSGTQGQKYGMPPEARGKKKKRPDRVGERKGQGPRTDKTTPYDTMTREELMRHREEEAQRMRNEK